jgi:hypothetical protein
MSVDDTWRQQTALLSDVHQDGPNSWGFSFYVGLPGVGEPGSQWVSASMPELAKSLREAMILSLREHMGTVTAYEQPETMLAAIETLWPETHAKVTRIRRQLGWPETEGGTA